MRRIIAAFDSLSDLDQGDRYFRRSKYGRAIECYSRVIHRRPNYAVAYRKRGMAFHKLKHYDEAIADYTNAIRLRPDYAKAYNYRAVAYCDLKHYGEALADCNEAIRLKEMTGYAEAHNTRGVVHHNLGHYDEAIADYDEAIRLDPYYAEARHNRHLTINTQVELRAKKQPANSASAVHSSSTTTRASSSVTTHQQPSQQVSSKTYSSSSTDTFDQFLLFVREGNLEQVKRAVAAQPNLLRQTEQNGANALTWAAYRGHLNVVHYLVDTCHMDINHHENSGYTALKWAQSKNHHDVVRYLENPSAYSEVKSQPAERTRAVSSSNTAAQSSRIESRTTTVIAPRSTFTETRKPEPIRPESPRVEFRNDYSDDTAGFWKDKQKHGIHLRASRSLWGSRYAFDLELYQEGSRLERMRFTHLERDGKCSESSYYWDEALREVKSLSCDDFSAHRSYYHSKSSALREQQSIIDKNVREESRRAEEERQRIEEQEREREREAERQYRLEQAERRLRDHYTFYLPDLESSTERELQDEVNKYKYGSSNDDCCVM